MSDYGCKILKVCEKNCYSYTGKEGNHCQHVCILKDSKGLSTQILNSVEIYNKMKDECPRHILEMYNSSNV